MPRLVFAPRYLKMQKPSQVKNYVKYVATRPNAEKFEVDQWTIVNKVDTKKENIKEKVKF